MPTWNENGIENAYMVDENGNVIWKVSHIETVTMAVTDDDATSYEIPRSISFSTTMKLKAERTNRKVFCRELMKLGFTKSESKEVARSIRKNYGEHLAAIRVFGKEYATGLIGGKK